ncbi:hypothetical protein D7V88_04195 [Corallococcus terminator]|uniref:Uncharacterized protein n=2 Tax=Corallococcus terminator TaxID=2316733 RepID=A0A3A8JMF8_9BACT|nr:hypothetical protein D7V88_04195 [Corallococcus terminator]
MTVYDEAGESAVMRAVDGQALHATNEALKLSYRIVPEVIGPDAVRYKIYNDYDLDSASPIEVIEARADGQVHRGLRASFSVSVTTIDERPLDVNPLAAPSPDEQGITCCITCGKWKYCCTPSPGYCCTISTSCGLGCRVCK